MSGQRAERRALFSHFKGQWRATRRHFLVKKYFVGSMFPCNEVYWILLEERNLRFYFIICYLRCKVLAMITAILIPCLQMCSIPNCTRSSIYFQREILLNFSSKGFNWYLKWLPKPNVSNKDHPFQSTPGFKWDLAPFGAACYSNNITNYACSSIYFER